MDNSTIYKKVLLIDAFNEIKNLRNSYDVYRDNNIYTPSLDICGKDYRLYSFIMNESRSKIIYAIRKIIIELFNAYGIKARWFPISKIDAHIYIKNGSEIIPEYVAQANGSEVYAFRCENELYKDNLYIFKEYGIGNYLPNSLIEEILMKFPLKNICYISFVDEDAETEILNYNYSKNSNRSLISLKQFFDMFFSNEEYIQFKKYSDLLVYKIKEYFGFEIVRTLRPNTMHNFRAMIRDEIYRFDVSKIDIQGKISDDQRKLIEKNFFENKNCELIIGKSDFAQSYLTSEWLYTSLGNAGNIDLTAIAMGYFKSIEQILFEFIKLHTFEKDSINRQIFISGERNTDLTDSLIQNEEKTKKINLSSLSGFFGHYFENRNFYENRNKDLLVSGINDNTYHYIIDTLEKVVGLRNEFFHKNNLSDWNIVEDARNNARLIFYLILGSYNISEQEKNLLGIINHNLHNDYYRLYEYMNRISYNSNQNKNIIPIFYVDDSKEYWMVKPDKFIEYNEYGEPIYSGIYFFRRETTNIKEKTINDNNIPKEIWEGTFTLFDSDSFAFKESGPIKKIFSDEKFLL